MEDYYQKQAKKELEKQFIGAIRVRGHIIMVVWLAFLLAVATHLPHEYAVALFMWGGAISVAIAIKIKILF